MYTRFVRLTVVLMLLNLASASRGQSPESAAADPPRELKVWKIPGGARAAECYFSPDSKSLIYNARVEGDKNFRVHTVNIDGSTLRQGPAAPELRHLPAQLADWRGQAA